MGVLPWAGLAGTRAQSGDWYGSDTLHPGQVLRGSLPLLSPINGLRAEYGSILGYYALSNGRNLPSFRRIVTPLFSSSWDVDPEVLFRNEKFLSVFFCVETIRTCKILEEYQKYSVVRFSR
jgi:hypothetical protein